MLYEQFGTPCRIVACNRMANGTVWLLPPNCKPGPLFQSDP